MKIVLVLIISLVVLLILVAYLAPGAVYRAVMSAERILAGLRTRTVAIDDIQYTYNDSGTGVPLLLIHGFSADKDHWTRIARHLTGDFRVIAPDLTGFGDSSRDPALGYRINEQVKRLETFIDTMGLKTFHLGGSSMGGAIATLLAARNPDRVLSLWLLAPAGVETAELSEMQQILLSGKAHPLIPANLQEFEDTLDFVFARRPFLPAPMRRYLTEIAVDRYELLKQIYAELMGDPADGSISSINTLVVDLTMPALVVWGTQDRVLHPAGAKVLGELFPNAAVEIMPGVGHLPMLERPKLTANRFLRFQQSANLPQ